MSGYNSISQNKILLQKSNIVKGIVENLENTKFLVAVNYNGHFTNSLNLLRSELKQEQTKLKIFKNTFFKRALLTLNERGNSQ
jgi:ribosomal protein L10